MRRPRWNLWVFSFHIYATYSNAEARSPWRQPLHCRHPRRSKATSISGEGKGGEQRERPSALAAASSTRKAWEGD
eukprot:164709-Pyramimonas_sp.AAC.1